MGKKNSLTKEERIRRENLSLKKNQCDNFLRVICIGGITIPLLLHIIVIGESTTCLTITAILALLTPSTFAYLAFRNYDLSVSETNEIISKKEENKGNMLLYVGGIFSILLITVYIVSSGGVKDNIMAYYYLFIPSATAVAFKTRWGLRIVSITYAVCISLLYWEFYNYGYYDQPSKWIYLLFSIYQICLIMYLECKTNKLSIQ